SITDDTRSLSSPATSPQPSELTAAFPPDFLWGAATSAYQIEGAVHEDGRSLSVWDRFAAIPGSTYRGQTGELAADHYHRMEEDVALMAELNLNAYRFSLSWPRILPHRTGASMNPDWNFFTRWLLTWPPRVFLPSLPLHHWLLPWPCRDQGGWSVRITFS